MRILLAKLFVAITAVLIVALAVVFAALRSGPGLPVAKPEPTSSSSATRIPPPADARMGRGSAVFVEQRCRKCHSFRGEGNTRSPLDGVGDRLSEWQIRQWIVAPATMKPGIAKRAYKLSPEDLDALVAYLKTGDPGTR